MLKLKSYEFLVLAAGLATFLAFVTLPSVRMLSATEISAIVGGQDDVTVVTPPLHKCGVPSQACNDIRLEPSCTQAQNAAQCIGLCKFCNNNGTYRICEVGTVSCTNDAGGFPGPCGALHTASCIWGPPPGNPGGPAGCRCPVKTAIPAPYTNTGTNCDRTNCV